MTTDAMPSDAAQAAFEGEPQSEPTAEPVAPQSGDVQPDSSADPQQGTSQPQGFQFAGRSFVSQEDAEQYFQHTMRSAVGRLKKMEGELQALRQPPQTQAPPPEKESPPYDTAVYSEILRVYGQAAADQYRITETQKFEQERLQKRFEERLAPLEAEVRRREVEASTVELFSRAKDARDPQGNLLFPELSHDETARAVVQLWSRELSPEVALTPQGIRHAVLMFRGMARPQTRSTTPPRPGPSGESVAPGVTPGFTPGKGGMSTVPSNVPRQLKTDPVTGERYY